MAAASTTRRLENQIKPKTWKIPDVNKTTQTGDNYSNEHNKSCSSVTRQDDSNKCTLLHIGFQSTTDEGRKAQLP